MKKSVKKTSLAALLLISAVLLLSRFGITPQNHRNQVYVSRVIDGDTIELSSGEKVRYIGIDTPETREKKGLEWVYAPRPYAKEAKDLNVRLVQGRRVRLEFDAQRRDKYSRLLAYVYVGDKMVNVELLKAGYAMIYTYPPNVKHTEELLAAQKLARQEGKGLWRQAASGVISSYEARHNVGSIRIVEAEVYDTFISDKVLILNCGNNFKVAIFMNNLEYFPKEFSRSPDSYFKGKTIRVCGVIKKYKSAYEIIANDPSQLEVL
ncbi:MAG: thermonuclease family protein [Candidatus Omnitrophica bacterium]|nr:thermonuclease family protein [Candidatus Omnitrophota bacterium]